MRARWLIAGMAAIITSGLTFGYGHAEGEVLDYVALGDSAAAGPLIPNQDINLLCARSSRNYPAVVARALGARLTDVTCSGAELTDFSGRQFGLVPPQYAALNTGTDVVTLTIGANDIDMVPQTLTCINLLREPWGLSCADRLTAGGKDVLGDAITAWAPEFGKALDEIRRRAPHAQIVVVGYPTYIRPGGCHPTQPIWARDADYIQSSVNKLSATMREQASARGATFVDLAPVSVGHDTCAAPGARYLEGLVPTTLAAPLHPNAAGMAAFGNAVAQAVTP